MHTGTTRQKLVFTLLALGAMSGCASMSQDECRAADWYTIGFEDGVRGNGADMIGKHREACAKHDIAPNFEQYQSGRDAGLLEFCQPSKAYRLGAAGGYYNGVCNPELEADFLPAYRDGHHLYQLQSKVNAIDSALRSNHAQVEENKQLLIDKEMLVIADETSKEDRILLLKEIWDLGKFQGELDEEILELEKARVLRIQELENYRQEMEYQY